MNIIKDIKLLRIKSEPVESREETNTIIKMLEESLNDGVGLSAPQIGINLQIAIIRCENVSVNIVNPQNVKFSEDKFIFKEEGCLSFPGLRKNTLRSRKIEFNNGFMEEQLFYSLDEFSDTVVVLYPPIFFDINESTKRL